MGAILRLSLLVGAQIGAKRGKLRLLGGLRGAKLELKGALEAPQETPKWSKRATRDFDGVAAGVLFGPGDPPKVT